MKWQLFLYVVLTCPLVSWGQSFSYPVPPDSIRDRNGRIEYMTKHFWNEKTVSDTTCFQSPKLLLDYLYLLKQTNETDRYVQDFVSLSCRQERTFGQILYWLDNILYDSSSPHYNEALYMKFLDAVILSDADSVMKLIPLQRKDIISKNQVGKEAFDFSFIDKADIKGDLYGIDAPLLLLIFNNPECSLCHKTEEYISKNDLFQELMKEEILKILTITPDADYDDWMGHCYPSNWIVGYDKEKIIYNQRLYDIQRLPCLYLLDKNKRVLLKEANYERLCKFLSENMTNNR